MPGQDDRKEGSSPAPRGQGATEDVTNDLVQLMPRDLVFSMRFLGESQYLLQRHFQTFIETELGGAGISQDTHPMIHAFIERHAILMRDFVFSGVALSRQFQIAEIERLIGDETSLLRVDIWDQLKSHIDTAERQFRTQMPGIPQQLAGWETPETGERGR